MAQHAFANGHTKPERRKNSQHPYQIDTNDGGAWVEGTPFRLQTLHILPSGRSSQRYFSEGVLETGAIQTVTSTKLHLHCALSSRRTATGRLTNTRGTFQIYQLRFFRVNPKPTFVISPRKACIESGQAGRLLVGDLPKCRLASRLKVLH